MNTNLAVIKILITCSIFFYGCSGEVNLSNTEDEGPLITGTFIDDPVVGLSYTCSSGIVGKTDSAGQYLCLEGDTVAFSLGSIELPSIKAGTTVTPYTLFPDNNLPALNLARLLQTLASDSDPAKLILMEDEVSKLTTDVNMSSENFDNEIGTLLKSELVSISDAEKRLNQNLINENITVNIDYDTPYGTILSNKTGKRWLDKNLGATKVCESIDDEACFGHYYQWATGRPVKSHLKNSPVVPDFILFDVRDIQISDSILSLNDVYVLPDPSYYFVVSNHDVMQWVTHSIYITSFDGNVIYKSPNLGGTESLTRTAKSLIIFPEKRINVCPDGYKIATLDDISAEGIESMEDAFNKFKIPAAGYRSGLDGTYTDIGTRGTVWLNSTEKVGVSHFENGLISDPVYNNQPYTYNFNSASASLEDPYDGRPMRCVSDGYDEQVVKDKEIIIWHNSSTEMNEYIDALPDDIRLQESWDYSWEASCEDIKNFYASEEGVDLSDYPCRVIQPFTGNSVQSIVLGLPDWYLDTIYE